MIHWLVRFSPSIVMFVWAVAASTDGISSVHIGFMVAVAIALAASGLERAHWKRENL